MRKNQEIALPLAVQSWLRKIISTNITELRPIYTESYGNTIE